MANSILKLYKVGFTPTHNAMVDHIDEYLTKAPVVYSTEFQYIKHELDLSIKISMNQNVLNDFRANYVSIRNSNETRTYYYFIVDRKWISTQSIELSLSMDTINTFQEYIVNQWDPRTNILREHKDRFLEYTRDIVAPNTILRDVSLTDEGFGNLMKTKISTSVIYDTTGKDKWYLIYNTDKNISTNPDEIVPISCYLAADTTKTYSTDGGNILTLTSRDLVEGPNQDYFYYCVTYADNPGGELIIGGRTLTVTAAQSYIYYSYQGDLRLISVNNNTSAVGPVVYGSNIILRNIKRVRTGYKSYIGPELFKNNGWYQVASKINDYIDYNTADPIFECASIKDVDRTLSTLIKIIELPYAPSSIDKGAGTDFNVPNGWTPYYNVMLGKNGTPIKLLKLDDLATEFGQTLVNREINEFLVNIPHDLRGQKKDEIYESKLYNSNFFNIKYAYDNFSKTVDLERLDAGTVGDLPSVDIFFKPSNAISDKMLFKIEPDADIVELEDHENIMLVNRNNEYPIYNSSYLNYLRSGYAVDKEVLKSNQSNQWLNVGVGGFTTAAGAALSFLTANPISIAGTIALAGNTVNSLVNTVHSQEVANLNFNQKLNDLRLQAGSVTNSDDLNLMNFYTYNNKLIEYKYSIPLFLKNSIYAIFNRGGYAANYRGIPNLDSRRDFNYIQCDPFFKSENVAEWAEYLDDVKSRFKSGVTVFHKFNNGVTDIYDFKQEYENWETWLCSR